MRWVCFAVALLAVSVWVSPAAGLEPGSGVSTGCNGCGINKAGGACAGGGWSPGCCVCQPSCCDNAWAGYCQQKARWQAFWARVGTPRPPHCASRVCPPGAVMANCGEPIVVKRLPTVPEGSGDPSVAPVPTPAEPDGSAPSPPPPVPSSVEPGPASPGSPSDAKPTDQTTRTRSPSGYR